MTKKKKKVYVPKIKKYPQIRVTHNRRKGSMWTKGKDKAYGGNTNIKLEIEFGVIYVGVSICWNHEAYNKIKGKSIAFGRLMRAYKPGHNAYNCMKMEKIIRAQIGKVDERLYQNALQGIKPVDPVKVYVPKEKN